MKELAQRQPAVAISFDDGRIDNYRVIMDTLVEDGLPSTVYITTGFVDGTCENNLLPTSKHAMTITNIQQLFSEPLVEIGLHGDKHLNSDEDIITSRNKMIGWLSLPEDYRFGFSSPGSGFSIEKLKSNENESCIYYNGLSYIAVGPRYRNLHLLRVLARKISRVIPSGLLYTLAYGDTLLSSKGEVAIPRVPILAGITAHQVICLVKYAMFKHSDLVLMFHSIEELPDDNWSWSKKRFAKLCDFLRTAQSKKKCQVLTVENIAKLAIEE